MTVYLIIFPEFWLVFLTVVLANLLAFYLVCILPLYLPYLSAFYLAHLLACVLAGSWNKLGENWGARETNHADGRPPRLMTRTCMQRKLAVRRCSWRPAGCGQLCVNPLRSLHHQKCPNFGLTFSATWFYWTFQHQWIGRKLSSGHKQVQYRPTKLTCYVFERGSHGPSLGCSWLLRMISRVYFHAFWIHVSDLMLKKQQLPCQGLLPVASIAAQADCPNNDNRCIFVMVDMTGMKRNICWWLGWVFLSRRAGCHMLPGAPSTICYPARRVPSAILTAYLLAPYLACHSIWHTLRSSFWHVVWRLIALPRAPGTICYPARPVPSGVLFEVSSGIIWRPIWPVFWQMQILSHLGQQILRTRPFLGADFASQRSHKTMENIAFRAIPTRQYPHVSHLCCITSVRSHVSCHTSLLYRICAITSLG